MVNSTLFTVVCTPNTIIIEQMITKQGRIGICSTDHSEVRHGTIRCDKNNVYIRKLVPRRVTAEMRWDEMR